MQYREIRPFPALSRFVKCIWTLEGQAYDLTAREKILPDGCMELVFHYGDRFRYFSNDKTIEQPGNFIYGQLTQSIELAATGSIGIIAVRFFPHGLHALTGLPLKEIADKWVTLQELFGNAWKNEEERILNTASLDDKVHLLQHFLVKQVARNNHYDHIAEEWVRRILHSNGSIAMDGIISGQRISHRQVERRFTAAVGINPKMLSRIVRLQHFLQLAAQGNKNSISALALMAGYYDQSHFSRDFKAITGVTPSSYFTTQHALSDHLVSG